MRYKRLFLDTAFVQALLSKQDEFHEKAKSLANHLREAKKVWTTETVLTEIGNALSKIDRERAVRFIRNCYKTKNVQVVQVDTSLFKKALALYEKYDDKKWGMTDCISIVVMKDNNLTIAFTADKHFSQAGFEIVL